jgi:hypothetical protein
MRVFVLGYTGCIIYFRSKLRIYLTIFDSSKTKQQQKINEIFKFKPFIKSISFFFMNQYFYSNILKQRNALRETWREIFLS